MKHFIALLTILSLSFTSFSQCGGDITFDLSVPPAADGTYPPNTVVGLCVTMTNWNGNAQGSNWLEGFGLTLGSGWVNVTPVTPPNDAEGDASGTWIWVNSVTSDATGLTAGPGYFFEGPTGPTDGNPGNDWGDYCMNGDCVWTFCVELTSSSVSGESLDIGVTPYADGSMGSWGTEMCFDEEVEIIDSEVGCNTYGCTDPIACNYDANAACDDGSCTLAGCTSVIACNYDINAACDDGSCTFGGCTDPLACNFDPLAGCDNGSCDYFSIGPITSSNNSDTVCIGIEILYSVTGNVNSTYDWNVDGGEIFLPNQSKNCTILWGNIPGIYTVTVQETTESGCLGPIETFDVVVIVPDITFDTTNYSMCLGQSVVLNAYPGGGTWDSESMNGHTFVSSKSGTYYPSYTTNIHGCNITENVEVEVRRKYEAPSIIYSAEIINFCTDSYEQTYFADDSIGITYGWFVDNIKQSSFAEQLIMTWYDTTQTYIIKVIAYDEIGCESEPKLISVRTETCQRFFAPNSFTPNGDGTNDIFKISGLSVYEPTLKIFNRWGDVVYTSSNLWWTGDGGTGYYCETGVYNWIIDYRDKDGFHKQNSGYVTLIR